MRNKKYSVILGNLGNTCDRFLSSGYKASIDKDRMLSQAVSIEGVTGIELVGTWDIDAKSVAAMKQKLADKKLQCSSIIPDMFAQKRWGKGSLSAPDADIRQQAVAELKSCTDIAVELGCDLVNLWPGQDGYDYPLAADYIEERQWLIEGVQEVAKYALEKGVRIALEYKMKEPRTHSYLARASDTLLIAQATGLDNVGITIDTGHAFLAYENVGEIVALLKMHGDRLFHMHFNDNYTSWDDDMIVGSIHLVDYFEMLYWLEKTGYEGWYSMDQYPYREDGYLAIRSSVLFLQRMHALLGQVGMAAVEQLVRQRDPVVTTEFIREHLVARA
jgi:sugar phosphate isomerase/epimerase